MGQSLSENRDQFALRLNCSMTTDSDLLNKSFCRGKKLGERKKKKEERKNGRKARKSPVTLLSFSRYVITENLTLYMFVFGSLDNFKRKLCARCLLKL